jgi:hypothetical protein
MLEKGEDGSAKKKRGKKKVAEEEDEDEAPKKKKAKGNKEVLAHVSRAPLSLSLSLSLSLFPPSPLPPLTYADRWSLTLMCHNSKLHP